MSNLQRSIFDAHVWEQPLITIFDSIRLIADAIYIVSNGSYITTQLYKELVHISRTFLIASLDSLNIFSSPSKYAISCTAAKNSKPHDTKITYYFQRIILVLESNKFEETVDLELQPSYSNSSSSSIDSGLPPSRPARENRREEGYLFTPLVHPMIETGLVLAEFVGRESKPRNEAFQNHLIRLCVRYILAVSNVMTPLLDASIFDRLKVKN